MLRHRALSDRKRLLSKGRFENHQKGPTVLLKLFKKIFNWYTVVELNCTEKRIQSALKKLVLKMKSWKVPGLQTLGLQQGFILDLLGKMEFTAPQNPQLNWKLRRVQHLPIVCNSKNAQIFLVWATAVYSYLTTGVNGALNLRFLSPLSTASRA